MTEWLGYRWLEARYGVTAVQPFRIESAIAGSRRTVRELGFTKEFYQPTMKPAETLAGHLTFALKHEGVHLEFLARLFAVLPPEELDAWVRSEPTGQYARRACFLYEYLTDRRLTFGGVEAGSYVAALDQEDFLTASIPVAVSRWRVRDNLPGTREWCPLVARTDRVRAAEEYDCASQIAKLGAEFGTELLQRSAVWLTLKESRASFAIESEGDAQDRVQRFAAAMERHCGRYEDPLSESALSELQAAILGPRAMRYGLRRSPVFVGETARMQPVVHYVAPHWDDLAGLLAGLRQFAVRTRSRSAILRAAALSFGFVYVHSMSDANGRISRFLINDTLRRDGAVPAPFVLPVSATITSTPAHRHGYDKVLESFSRELMRTYAAHWRFGHEKTGPDGVRYNLEFDAYQEALPAWRYPDLTGHAEYLAQVIRETLEQEMHEEATFLRNLRKAREGIKLVIEGPDPDIDRIIRSIRGNAGKVSAKLQAEFPQLEDSAVASAVVEAVATAFA